MKSKYLALGLSALLALSLVSCGGQQAQEPQEPTQEIQQAEPISAQPTAATVEVTDSQSQESALQEITHDELIEVFEKEYDISKDISNSDSEDTIQIELDMIHMIVKDMDKVLPSDYADQYRAWRPSVVQQQAEANSEVTLIFSEVNEQVWATGSVNLRSGPSTDNDKVGSLNKGNSVTRVGIGTGDYADWSKVKLSDGKEVYVASSYLTTTKPTTGGASGGSTSSIGNQNQTKPSTQTQPTTPQPSGGKAMYGGFNTYDEYIQDLHRQFPEYSIEEIKELNPDQATGGVNRAAIADAQESRLSGS